MATIKGQNLRILVGSNASSLACVAAAQSCQLRIDAIIEDTSSKDEVSAWTTKEITQLDWELTVDALVTSGIGLTVGQTYTVRLSQTNGDQNREQVVNQLQLTGKAICTDLQVTSENRKNVTYQAKFIGDGDIKQYSPE